MKSWQANILMMLTALIWGLTFAAQRLGMASVGPYTYNGVRFALGALSLMPLIIVTGRSIRKKSVNEEARRPGLFAKITILSGLLAGLILFIGASLQQVGLQYTTAGKAGFITGLYVVLVPLLGLFWRQRPDGYTWIGAFMAAAGLWFLCVNEAFYIEYGDVLELIGAFFWAGHVLLIGWLSPKLSALRLAFWQFAACSVLSLLTALAIEVMTLDGILAAALPILYGGLASVGVAYTLQVAAQKYTRPAHAAIILSMESPFAALGGWIVLGELMEMRSLTGCVLMLGGMLLSQVGPCLGTPRFLKKIESERDRMSKERMDGRMKGYACILLAAFFWGAIGPLGRTAFVEGVSPMEVAFWRAALAWGFFAVHAGIKKEMRVHRSDIPMILLFGTACVTCFYGAYQQAVAGGGAALASVLLYTAPAWVGVLARIFLKEAMTPVKLIALAMTILGVTGVSGGSPAGFSPAGMRTIGFGLLSGFCYALYYIFGKIFAERYSSPNLFLYALPVGAITLFPLVDFVPKTPTAWLALFLMALFSTYLAYYCYYIALKYLESTRAAIAAALEPVIASILGVVWWKEDLSFIAVCGGLLILSAVILVIRDSAPPADMQADGLSSAPPA